MINKTRLKQIVLVALSVLIVVSMASCKHTTTSSINANEVYATSGNYSVTNGELWNELKWSSTDLITEKIEEVVIAEYVTELTNVLASTSDSDAKVQKRYYDYLEQLSLSAVFNIAEYEYVKDLTVKARTASVQTFVDNIYVNNGGKIGNKTITTSLFTDESLDAGKKVMFKDTDLETTYYMMDIYPEYYDQCAKKILAYHYLEDYIVDYNADREAKNYYYTDSAIIQHHSENYQYSGDKQAILIRFTNEAEITSTLKAFGVKVYNKAFYFIPQGNMSISEYQKYYDEFDVSAAANSEKCFNLAAIGGEAAIFDLYIQMYNYIYSYRDNLPTDLTISNTTTARRNITEAIVAKYIKLDSSEYVDPSDVVESWTDQDSKESVIYTVDDFDDIDSNLKFYFAETLSSNPNYADGEQRYSVAGQSYGDFYYLVFNISEEEIDDSIKLIENPKTDTVIPEDKADFKQELIEEMMWKEITDSYINTRVSEKTATAKLYIYDEDVEILWSSTNTDYSKTHKNAPSSDTLYTIKYNGGTTNVSITDVYNKLEAMSGSTVAIDLLSKKAIYDSEEYKDTAKDSDDYKENIELLLAYFANDQLSSYSSTLGKYNFLKLYFHSTDIDTIVNTYYRLNAASDKILTDYANNENFYNLVLKYATKANTNDFKMSASNVTIYVDFDEDGNPDKEGENGFSWSNYIYGSQTKTFADLANELMNYFIGRMKNSSSTQLTTLKSLITEYQECQRFTNGIDEYTEGTTDYDPTEPETIWASYKRYGLYVKIDDYTDITNASDAATISEELKVELSDIYQTLKLYDTFPSEYVDSNDYINGTGNLITDGYSMIVVSSVTDKSSAKFEAKDDVNGVYTDITLIYDENLITISDIYNNEDIVSLNQIKLFVYEYLIYGTTTLFPTDVQTAISAYVTPVYTKYTDSSSQRELLLNKLLTSGVSFANSENDTRFAEIREINKRASDSYLSDTDMANNFAGWWTDLTNLSAGGQQ